MHGGDVNSDGEQRACLSTEELQLSLVKLERRCADTRSDDDDQKHEMHIKRSKEGG